VCAVHDAAKALVQQSSQNDIDETLRMLIVDGLAACERLQPRLDPASILRATTEFIEASEGR
jgi:hypothetical protein